MFTQAVNVGNVGKNDLSEWMEKRLKIQDDILEELTKEIDQIKEEMDGMRRSGNGHELRNKVLRIEKQMAALSKMRGNVLNDDEEELDGQEKMQKWLKETVKLPQYYQLLVQQGFDDLESIADITKDDLISMGIDKVGHQRKILKNSQQLSV